MNTVNLVGRITKTPELINGDTSRVRFSLAVPRRFSKNDDTDFISCVAFGKTAEFISQYFSKGDRIALTGHIQTGSYDFQIAKNKSKRIYTTDVVVESVTFADAKKTA